LVDTFIWNKKRKSVENQNEKRTIKGDQGERSHTKVWKDDKKHTQQGEHKTKEVIV